MKRQNVLMKAYTITCAWATLAVAAAILITFTLTSCNDSEVINNLPSHVTQFVDQYWPGSSISAYSKVKDEGCTVTIKDGPTVKFDEQQAWIDIKGNGVPLPSTLLFDQLPEPLYDFLEEMQSTGEVYGVTRDASTYTLTLLDSKISYDIATGKVKYI